MGTGPESGRLSEAMTALADGVLNEDLALSLLKRPDLRAQDLELLSKNVVAMESRRVKLGLVRHPKTPRRLALPLLRHLFTFELMQVSLSHEALADIRKVAEEALLKRIETISLGEKLTLARRASGKVVARLLLDPEPRVIDAALQNSRLTEASVIKAILRDHATAALVQAVCRHFKWSVRKDVRIALLRSENTPLARALEFARDLPASRLVEILRDSRLAANVKAALVKGTQR